MLTRLLSIASCCLFLCAFGADYTDDSNPPPVEQDVTEGWLDMERKRLEEEALAAKNAKSKRVDFELVGVGDPLCGARSTPFRVALLKENPPFSWEVIRELPRDKDDISGPRFEYTYQGMNVKFMLNIFDTFGEPYIKYHVFDNYEQIERALLRGDVDIVPGIYYNSDPLIGIDYVFPAFLTNPLVGLFHNEKAAKDVKTFDNFAGLSGISQRIESLDNAISNFTSSNRKISIKQVDVPARSMYTALLNRYYDYIFTSLYAASAYRAAFDVMEDTFVSEPVRMQQLFIGFSKNTDCRLYKKYFEEYLAVNRHHELRDLFDWYTQIWVHENGAKLDYQKPAFVTPPEPEATDSSEGSGPASSTEQP